LSGAGLEGDLEQLVDDGQRAQAGGGRHAQPVTARVEVVEVIGVAGNCI
jgi:hypothetical protein